MLLLLRHPAAWCVALGSLAVAGYFGAEIYLLDGGLGFPLDDSWIHLQFARNLAAGEGLSYNPGTLVTGSTAPLWTALLSLAFVLPGSPLVWSKLLGIALFLLLIPATYRLARALSVGRGVSAAAAALTTATSWLVWSALSGMEIPLFALLSVAGIERHLAERRRGPGTPFSALLLALAMLARPEGLLLVLAAFADRVVGLWPQLWGSELRRAERKAALATLAQWLLIAAIVLVPTMIFYRAVGDGFLPTTFSAKSPGLQRLVPSLSYLWVVAGIFFPVQPWMTLLALAGCLTLVAEGLGDRSRAAFLPALWLVGLPLAYSLISYLGPAVLVGNFGRYYFPLVPMLVVAGAVAIDRLAAGLPGGGRPWRRLIAPLAVAALLLPTLLDLGRGAERYTRSVLNVEDSDVAMARWLETRLAPEAVLAVNDIGALRYLLPNQVVDLAGIGNPEIGEHFAAAEARGQHWRAGIESFLEDKRPDYLVVFPSWFPDLVADESRFRPIHRISIPHNITMGGDELAVYSTPWTRHPLNGR